MRKNGYLGWKSMPLIHYLQGNGRIQYRDGEPNMRRVNSIFLGTGIFRIGYRNQGATWNPSCWQKRFSYVHSSAHQTLFLLSEYEKKNKSSINSDGILTLVISEACIVYGKTIDKSYMVVTLNRTRCYNVYGGDYSERFDIFQYYIKRTKEKGYII